MARPQKATAGLKVKTVAENRRARYEYAIEDSFEAGIALTGTEVKSLRFGEGSIAESYAEVKNGEVWLVNANIPEFSHGNRFNHEPKRPRKLLLREREPVDARRVPVLRTIVSLAVWAGCAWSSATPTRASSKRSRRTCPARSGNVAEPTTRRT